MTFLNERTIESLVEDLLVSKGFSKKDIQYQGSIESSIQSLLNSKGSNNAGKGMPEFIIRLNGISNNLLVVEIKNNITKHSSGTANYSKPVEYAEDGVVHYMKGLNTDFNVIGLAISGKSTDSLVVSTFLGLQNQGVEKVELKEIRSPEEYMAIILEKEYKDSKEKTIKEILSFADKLHNFLRDEIEMSVQDKPKFISGILLALSDDTFKQVYNSYRTSQILAREIVTAIERVLVDTGMNNKKYKIMSYAYAFIKHQPSIANSKSLLEAVKMIDTNLYQHINTSVDVIGLFYGEFLSYGGSDKQGLGIVLTPKQTTELMVKLAEVDKNSVVLDTCTGTAGFLIAAMQEMIKDANGDTKKIEEIKANQLIGIEYNDNMFTLGCANMILRQDGKSNMLLGDSLSGEFDEEIKNKKPTVCLINPPYSKKKEDKDEFAFILKGLELLQPGGKLVAIVPMSKAIDVNKSALAWRKQILSKHTLKAVMSMPDQLFVDVGVVTCIMVFEAHKPHDVNRKTYFGYWKEDGYRLNKKIRIEKEPGAWEKIKKEWLDSYYDQTELNGLSCRASVNINDEWCSEAYANFYINESQELFNIIKGFKITEFLNV